MPHYTTKATCVNSMESNRLTEGFDPIIRKIIMRSLTLLLVAVKWLAHLILYFSVLNLGSQTNLTGDFHHLSQSFETNGADRWQFHSIRSMIHPSVLLPDPFQRRKITKDPHVLADVYSASGR